MQFTGLLDKNGKEIYEGDIVRYTLDSGPFTEEMTEYTEEVIFKDGCFVVDGDVPVYAAVEWGAEIIRNIFEEVKDTQR